MNNPVLTGCGRIFEGLRHIGTEPALIANGQTWTGVQVVAGTRHVTASVQACGLKAGHTLIWSDDDLPCVLGVRLAAMLIGARFEVAGPSSPQSAAPGRMFVTSRDVASFYLPSETAANLDSGFCVEAHFEVARGRFAWSAEQFDAVLAKLSGTIPDEARRVGILSTVSGFGGDVALAAWGAGRQVHLLATGTSAAKALAAVERCRAGVVASPADLLRSMMGHPSVALADLQSLRIVLYEEGGSGQLAVDATAMRKVLGATAIGFAAAVDGLHEVGEASQAVQSPLPIMPVPSLAAASEALEAEFAATDWHAETAVVQQLGQAALRSMLNAFLRCNLFGSPQASYTADQILAQASVVPPHRPLIRRWLRVLEKQGHLRADGNRLRSVLPATEFDDDAMERDWTAIEAAWRKTVGSSLTIDYARRNAKHLPELLAGRLHAVHLLFPEGRLDLARALYRESIAARYQHAAVQAVVNGLARGGSLGRPLRLIELGAGTGATTDALLPSLEGLGVDYLYTDVSRFFLDAARTRYERHEEVRFGRYDIDSPPQGQGQAPHSVDLVVAGGMLNAARDTDTSLGWIRQLLKPGGFLVVTEPTVEEFWVMASQAFMLPPAVDERADSGSTFLTLVQWRRSLDAAGFERVLELPRQGHPLEPLGHRLFAVRAPLAAPFHQNG